MNVYRGIDIDIERYGADRLPLPFILYISSTNYMILNH